MGLLWRVYQKQANRITNRRPVYKPVRFTIGSQQLYCAMNYMWTLFPLLPLLLKLMYTTMPYAQYQRVYNCVGMCGCVGVWVCVGVWGGVCMCVGVWGWCICVCLVAQHTQSNVESKTLHHPKILYSGSLISRCFHHTLVVEQPRRSAVSIDYSPYMRASTYTPW